ncbi:MAG: hypothetical protein OEV64_01580 [Desulfobulbaceae bacterium]|nr:hypothetical protein [Desulfobulbaceae bacterium]
MESPVFGIGGDGIDLQFLYLEQSRDYVFFSDAKAFPMVIDLPLDGIVSQESGLSNRL